MSKIYLVSITCLLILTSCGGGILRRSVDDASTTTAAIESGTVEAAPLPVEPPPVDVVVQGTGPDKPASVAEITQEAKQGPKGSSCDDLRTYLPKGDIAGIADLEKIGASHAMGFVKKIYAADRAMSQISTDQCGDVSFSPNKMARCAAFAGQYKVEGKDISPDEMLLILMGPFDDAFLKFADAQKTAYEELTASWKKAGFLDEKGFLICEAPDGAKRTIGLPQSIEGHQVIGTIGSPTEACKNGGKIVLVVRPLDSIYTIGTEGYIRIAVKKITDNVQTDPPFGKYFDATGPAHLKVFAKIPVDQWIKVESFFPGAGFTGEGPVVGASLSAGEDTLKLNVGLSAWLGIGMQLFKNEFALDLKEMDRLMVAKKINDTLFEECLKTHSDNAEACCPYAADDNELKMRLAAKAATCAEGPALCSAGGVETQKPPAPQTGKIPEVFKPTSHTEEPLSPISVTIYSLQPETTESQK